MPLAPDNWGTPKSPNNIASTFFNAKTLYSNMGWPNCLLAPGAIHNGDAREAQRPGAEKS